MLWCERALSMHTAAREASSAARARSSSSNGRGSAGAGKAEEAEDGAAGGERDGDVGVHSGAGQQGGGVLVAGDVRQVVSVGVADQHGPAGAHTTGGQSVGVVRGDLAGRIGGLEASVG